MNIHFKSETSEWATPKDFFDKLNDEFHFTLDPCATDSNKKVNRFFTKKDNGLEKSWESEIVFMNPPYGREIGRWVEKAYLESKRGALVICLIPSRTDTKWWHNYVMRSSEIRFVRGRIKFGLSKNSAPFPSAVIIFGKRPFNKSFKPTVKSTAA